MQNNGLRREERRLTAEAAEYAEGDEGEEENSTQGHKDTKVR